MRALRQSDRVHLAEHRWCAWLSFFHRRNSSDKQISAARDGLDDLLLAITKGLAHFTKALREGLVCSHCVRPNGLDQLIFAYEAIRVLHKVAKNLKAFRP